MNDRSKSIKLWKTIQQAEAEDDAEDILAMSDEELDRFISDNGGDPKAIRASGETLAKELLERRDRLAWHAGSQAKVDAVRAKAAVARTKETLPRPELLQRLAVARKDPRFATPVAAMFQKKTLEASTDEELQALLDQIELLRGLDSE